jgi:putative SbcD/Mre11-related phosphoesterase
LRNTPTILAGMAAHPSGALWLPDSQTVIVADVHLGYSWAQRRRGELGPLADARAREKLLRLCEELQPAEIVFLGDLVHAPRPCAPERAWIEQTLNELSRCARLVAVRGNHDRAFAKEFGHLNVVMQEFWSNGVMTAVHGDRLNQTTIPLHGTLVVGHLHPCLSVRDAAGACQKLPAFLVSRCCVVLPAFSPFARGYDVTCGLPEDLHACFRGHEIEAYIASSTRVVHLGSLRRIIEQSLETATNAPVTFRRSR